MHENRETSEMLAARKPQAEKEYHPVLFEPLASKKTAKIAVISTCA
jgi:hypothetical protein